RHTRFSRDWSSDVLFRSNLIFLFGKVNHHIENNGFFISHISLFLKESLLLLQKLYLGFKLHDLLFWCLWHIRGCLVLPIKGTKFSEPTHNCASGLDAILTASTHSR